MSPHVIGSPRFVHPHMRSAARAHIAFLKRHGFIAPSSLHNGSLSNCCFAASDFMFAIKHLQRLDYFDVDFTEDDERVFAQQTQDVAKAKDAGKCEVKFEVKREMTDTTYKADRGGFVNLLSDDEGQEGQGRTRDKSDASDEEDEILPLQQVPPSVRGSDVVRDEGSGEDSEWTGSFASPSLNSEASGEDSDEDSDSSDEESDEDSEVKKMDTDEKMKKVNEEEENKNITFRSAQHRTLRNVPGFHFVKQCWLPDKEGGRKMVG